VEMVEGDGWRASVECDMTGEEWLGTVLVYREEECQPTLLERGDGDL